MNRNRVLYISVGVIAISSFIVYSNILFNGFVYDDIAGILDNRWIRDWHNIPEILTKSVWGFYTNFESPFYRPLPHLIGILVFKLGGLSPFSFHLNSILFNSAVCLLVFLITRHILSDIYPESKRINTGALVAAIIFAVHPVHTEVVAWAAETPELYFSFFLLISFYCYIKWSGSNSALFLYPASLVSFFLAMLAKEPAAGLPFILIIYDFLFARRKRGLKQKIMSYLPYFAVLGLYILMRVNALGSFAPPNANRQLSAYEAIINVFPLLGKYLFTLFIPMELNVFHTFKPYTSIFNPVVMSSLAVAILMAVIAVIALKKDKAVFFSIMVFITPLLPALYIPALGRNAFAERYLYLPSFGLAFLVAILLVRAFDRGKKSGMALASALIVVIAVFSVATFERNRIWKNEFTLWYDTVQKSPDAAIPHDALGNAYFKMGKLDEAIEQYNVALRIQPTFTRAIGNLGNAYNKKGELDKAVEQYRLAIRQNPKDANFHNNLGIAYAKSGKLSDALSEFQTAVGINPYYSDGYNNLGLAYIKMGMREKAEEAFKKAVSLKPENGSYRKNLERV